MWWKFDICAGQMRVDLGRGNGTREHPRLPWLLESGGDRELVQGDLQLGSQSQRLPHAGRGVGGARGQPAVGD